MTVTAILFAGGAMCGYLLVREKYRERRSRQKALEAHRAFLRGMAWELTNPSGNDWPCWQERRYAQGMTVWPDGSRTLAGRN